MLGVPIDNMFFFVPPLGTIGHFSTMVSYNGKVTVGFCSAFPSEDATVRSLTDEFFEDELVQLHRIVCDGDVSL
jgi:hypothetical protein|tara:strand:- start:191 stop:412 length:222 start_codon:yes stop_codon:yes gene_type:complete